MLGCRADGVLNTSGFSKPLPIIGLYIAAGSLICALAMAADAAVGFRQRKYWFPSRFFPLNATTLTLLTIATKLPVDINTSMPTRQDQLTKLSGTVLLCTVMGNFLPSLGTMEDSDIASNVVALCILVLTVAVNVCIQMGTGVIFVFLPEHFFIMFFMLVLLLIMVSSALAVPITKRFLEEQYDQKHREARDSEVGLPDRGKMYRFELLKECVKKYWLMARTSSPQYVLGRSVTCTASGAFCLISALILVEAFVRSLISMRFCNGKSDYGWSTTVVFMAQAIAIAVGTIAPAYRLFKAINYRTPGGRWRCSDHFNVEGYWTQRLMEWREAPLPFQNGGRRSRKVANDFKNMILDRSMMLQAGVVLLSKLVRLVPIFLSWLKRATMGLVKKRKSSPCTSDEKRENLSEYNLSKYVLYLEGEEDLVMLIMKSGRKDTEQWIDKSRKNKPTKLIQLIRNSSTLSKGFTGVTGFDSDRVLSIVVEEPPNCWALPIVTLASIAVALPHIDRKKINSLLRGVSEGFRYIRLVEKNLDGKGLLNMREAADIVWLGIDLYDRWHDEDLQSLILEHKNGKKIVEKLGDIAKNRVEEHQKKMKAGNGTSRNPLEWPAKVLAANCMYRVTQTILLQYDDIYETDNKLFLWLQTTISDILGACLTNLSRAIYMECLCDAIKVSEKSIRKAANLLGEAEEIMKILRDAEEACLYPQATEYIEYWSEERHCP